MWQKILRRQPGGLDTESPRIRTGKAKNQPPPPDQTPIAIRDTVDNTMMELLLDMSSRMQAMEEFVAQHNHPTLMGNRGPIPDRSSDHAQLNDAATNSSTWVAAGCLMSSGTIALTW